MISRLVSGIGAVVDSVDLAVKSNNTRLPRSNRHQHTWTAHGLLRREGKQESAG